MATEGFWYEVHYYFLILLLVWRERELELRNLFFLVLYRLWKENDILNSGTQRKFKNSNDINSILFVIGIENFNFILLLFLMLTLYYYVTLCTWHSNK